MIISATRRTDIPSYYGKWFVNRLKAGYVLIPNPYNENRYSKASLLKEHVDMIVFWTKNPIPFIKYLDEIDKMGYQYYFQFTITPYGKETEKNLPPKEKLIETFIYLSKRLGSKKMVWRYDPIIINDKYTVEYHIKKFKYIANKLKSYTNKCVISFIDTYKNISYRNHEINNYQMNNENIHKIVKEIATIAKENNMKILTCSEEIDLSKYSISKSSCIDKNIIEEILDMKINAKIDKNQREECRCIESIEIGTYNCCANGCNYCYALTNEQTSNQNIKNHNPESETLIGEVKKDAIITNRETKSIIINQMSLF